GAGAGFYLWLSGHRVEGLELLTAAADVPGEVEDETRALVYALVVMFVTAGLGNERQAEEWIHKTYRLRQSSGSGNPLLELVVPLERSLREPDGYFPAWEELLESEDPWVRALGRLHLGKMRNLLGDAGWDADTYLEVALAEFRELGERFGISFALSELAERITTRGEFARACEYYEEAVTVVTEVGAVEDVIHMRARQAHLYRLLGDADAEAAAM
ncbi:AfsR/SARP family transcriptional regulator, partial [Actinomadura adrarensis]